MDLTYWDTNRRGMPGHAARLIWSLDMVKDRQLRRHLMKRVEEYLDGCSAASGEGTALHREGTETTEPSASRGGLCLRREDVREQHRGVRTPLPPGGTLPT